MAKECEDDGTIKCSYIALAKKYKLPDYETMNADFEIEVLEDVTFVIRQIRMRMIEKIGFFAKLMEDLLNPDSSSFVQLQEYDRLSEKEKGVIFDWLKRFVAFDRHAICFNMVPNETKEATLISDMFTVWQDAKKVLSPLFLKIAKSWENPTIRKKDVEEYLG